MRVVNLNLQPGYIYTNIQRALSWKMWSIGHLMSDDAIPLSLTFLKGVSR